MALHNFKNLRTKLQELIDAGYKSDFTLFKSRLYSYDSKKYYYPTQITLEEIYRFKENRNSTYEASLFKISCDGGEKGTIVTSSEQIEDKNLYEFMRLVKPGLVKRPMYWAKTINSQLDKILITLCILLLSTLTTPAQGVGVLLFGN